MKVELYSIIRFLKWKKENIADQVVSEANNAKMAVLQEVIDYLEGLKG